MTADPMTSVSTAAESERTATGGRVSRRETGLGDAEIIESASLGLLEMTLAAVAAEDRMSVLQLRALIHVERHGASTPTRLAAALDLSSSSATRLLDRLEEAGLVARGHATHSRREVRVTLTRAGSRCVERVRASRRRAVDRVLAAMSRRQRDALITGLRGFAAAVEVVAATEIEEES